MLLKHVRCAVLSYRRANDYRDGGCNRGHDGGANDTHDARTLELQPCQVSRYRVSRFQRPAVFIDLRILYCGLT